MTLDVSAHAVDRYRERVSDGNDFVSTREKLSRKLSSVAGSFIEGASPCKDFRIHCGGVTYCVVRNGDCAKVLTCFVDRRSQRMNRYNRRG